MGLDVYTYLPPSAESHNILTVTALLAGCPGEWKSFKDGGSKDYFGVDKKYANFIIYGAEQHHVNQYVPLPSMVLKMHDGNKFIDGNDTISFFLHMESDLFPGFKMVSRYSNPFSGAIGKGLINFFGGLIDYNDCDDIAFNQSKDERSNIAHDGKDWKNFQKRLSEVEPVTMQNMLDVEKYVGCTVAEMLRNV